MDSPYNFGLSQEEERSEARALDLRADAAPEPVFYRDYYYVGMFAGEQLVGYLMTGLYPGWTGATEGLVRYVGDARVLKEARGDRLTDRAAAVARDAAPADSFVGFCLVKRGNRTAASVVGKAQQGTWALRPLCGFEVSNVPLVRRLAPPGVARGSTAEASDLEPMAAMIQRANGRRLLAPLVSAADLAQAAQDRPGHDLWKHYLAERNGRLVGCLIAWDMWQVHRAVVLRYPPVMNTLRRAVPLARRVLPHLARLPAPGQAFLRRRDRRDTFVWAKRPKLHVGNAQDFHFTLSAAHGSILNKM